MTTKFWNIKSTDECNDELINCIKYPINQKHFLLDVKKTKMNLLEKFVHETTLFHFTNLKDNYVEFWCEDKVSTQNLSFESDKFPIKSCISYFNKNECPTIITNIDIDNYLYKEFESQTEFILSFPRLNKQITFDGKWFNNSVTLSENDDPQNRYAIFINLWHSKPGDLEYYKQENENELAPVILSIDEDTNMEKIVVSKKIMNARLYENLLYKCEKTALSEFASFINDATHSYRFIKESSKKRTNVENIKKMKLHSKIYTPDMCRYIINESEKHYAKDSINNSTNNTWDLSIDKIPSVFGLIIETMTTVTEKLNELHNLNEETRINIKNLFIRKSFINSDQTLEEMKQNNSIISINILLSKNEENNETHIAHDKIFVLEQGDLLIHSDNSKCTTKGVQYNLIGFININKLESESKSKSESKSEFDCCAVSF